jgi:hypothetical protein
MRLSAVQLDDGIPLRVPNIAVHAAAQWALLAAIAHAVRQPMATLDVSPVAQLER